MRDEPWGTYGAYQSAASVMLAALKRVVSIRDWNHDEAADAEHEYRNAAEDCRAAIAAAEAAGVDAAEEQGERERSDRSEPLPSTGGRTDALKAALEKLANAADAVGVQFFDTDTMAPEVEAMQTATQEARSLLSPSLGEKE